MDAKETNPYAAPSAARLSTRRARPHGTSILKEAWRGARFGAKLTAIGLASLMVIIWLYLASVTLWYRLSRGDSPLIQMVDVWDTLESLATAIIVIAVVSAMGGGMGALVMSMAALVRKFRRRIDEN